MPVTNDKEFREWLKKQPQEVCVAIAFRAAMRVLPLAVLARDDREIWSNLALAVFRASLTSGVVAARPTPDVKVAAAAAADAADAADAARATADASYAADAARSAADAAYAAARAASALSVVGFAASAAARAARRAASYAAGAVAAAAARFAAYADTNLISNEITRAAIGVPSEVLDAISGFAVGKTDVLRAGGPWTFWATWYDRAMAGDPLPWDLQEKIALIPNEIWKAGPDAVAEEIKRIEADYWAEHLPQAEEVVPSEDGRFDVRPSVTADDTLMERIFRQTEFALDLSLNTNCGFSEMCVGFKVLRYTLDNLRDDPNSVEQNLRMARDIIAKKVASKDYDNHDALTVLVESLNQHALELRGQHSEVRAAYEVRVQQTLREIDDITRVDVAEAMREFQREKAAGRLYEETGLDAETVESGATVEAQATAIQRTGGRAAVARGLERASQAAKEVDASGGYKATRIGTTGYTIVEMLLKVFGG